MKRIFQQTSLIIWILASLVSCSSFNKTNVAENSNEDIAESVENETAATLQAKSFEAKDATRIVGSSSINEPQSYDGKTYFLYGAEHLNLDNYYFDIPVVYNDKVRMWIKYFLNRGRGFFERYSARAGRYAPVLSKILEEHGLPKDLIFLAMAESGFQSKAKSWAKAVGPWQFMPYTGKRFGLKIDWYVDERRDPIKSTIAASRYLKRLYEDFGSWELAAASYNAGEGKVGRAIRRYRTENFWQLSKGRYLKAETKNYVPKIMALAIIGKNLKAFGFDDIDFHEPLDFDEVQIPGETDLFKLAELSGISYEEITRYNPEVMRWFTPPGEVYNLRLPVGGKRLFEKHCAGVDLKAKDFQTYRVRGHNSRLRDVAKKFKIKDSSVLEYLNGFSEHAKLNRGHTVVLPFRIGQDRKAEMYADLYDKPRKSVVRRKNYLKRIRIAKKRGKKIENPSEFYTVQRGDSLWSVSKKTGVSMDTIIASNLNIISHRMIRAGDKLIVR